MRKLLTLLSLYIAFSTLTITGCGGSKEAQEGEGDDSLAVLDSALLDSASLAALSDSLSADSLGEIVIGELDSVDITTDTRIDPVAAIRSGKLSGKKLGVKLVEEKGLGCKYFLPKTWTKSRREYKNLVNYFYDGRISVTISVANSAFDSLRFWAQVQEAITYGKNQVPRQHWRFDPPIEEKSSAKQTYIGRYEFGGKQYNTAYYFHGTYQFHIIVSHKVDALTDEDAQAINYLMSTFTAGEPTVEIPKPITTSAPEEDTEDSQANSK